MKTLETKRLILRPFNERDLNDLYEYCQVEGVGELAGWLHHKDIETSKKILNLFIDEQEVYAIVYKENNKVIGSLGIHNNPNFDNLEKEIGYVISKNYWNQGLMTEAVKEVIRYYFEDLGYNILWCRHFDFNYSSQRVIQKNNFHYYKHETKINKNLDKNITSIVYRLTKEEYLTNR